MDLSVLSTRSLRSKITKHCKDPGKLEWNEIMKFYEEVQKRCQKETNLKKAEKWMHYYRLVEHMKELATRKNDVREQEISEDSMSELEDATNEQLQEEENEQRKERSWERNLNSERNTEYNRHRDRSTEGHHRRERNEERESRKERSTERDRHRERSSHKDRHHERHKREGRKELEREEEMATRKKLKRRSRRVYQSSEEENEEIYNHRDKRSRRESEERTDYSFIEAMETFEGDFSKWSLFRDVVESLVLEPRRIPTAMKITIINKLLKGTAHSIWNNQVASSKDIKSGWKALIRHYEDPRQIDAYLHGLVAKMPTVTHDADVKTLQDMYAQVMNFQALTERLGQDRGAQSRELCLIIANRFWNQESKKIKKDFNTIKQLTERVGKLLRDAQILSIHHKEPKVASFNRQFPPRISNVNVGFKRKCNFCTSEEHWSCDCTSPMSFEEKRRILSEKRLCGKCCRVGHFASNCRSRPPKCHICGKEHATVLHGLRISFINNPNVAVAEPQQEHNQERQEENVASQINVVKNSGERSFWTKTMVNGRAVNTLMDTGAAITLISEKCVPKYARYEVSPLIVQGFASGMNVTLKEKANLEIETSYGPLKFEAYLSSGMKELSLIIGRDQLENFLKPGAKVMQTVLGDYDFGKKQWQQADKVISECHALQHWHEKEDEEEVDESLVDMIVTKLNNGHYEARLPFMSHRRPKENYERAVRKHDRLMKRLEENGRKEEYGRQIMEFIRAGHAIEIQETSGHFIGHREVERPEAASTPFRVVLTPMELNELLWKGEARGLDVLGHAIRFRTTKHAFTADLQKAFLQVTIHPEDQSFLRFLWTTELGLRKYQMTVLPFGIVSAPAILTKVIEVLIEEMEPSTKAILKGSLYMDDVVSGHDDEEVMNKVLEQAQAKFGEAGFLMHKIRTNLGMNNKESEEGKVLGIHWNNKEDALRIGLPEMNTPTTRRELLSLIGRIFDPFGAYDPCKLGLRMLHSKIINKEWDESLEENMQEEVKQQLKRWKKGQEIILPRAFPSHQVLWCFSDASRAVFGYVMYLDDSFVFGKAKLVTTQKSIVAGELQALFELCKAIPKILKHLQWDLEVRIMSDSKVNLDRLKKSPNEHHIAEARRLFSILKTASRVGASFFHIRGIHNPADYFSRAQELRNSHLWLKLDTVKTELNMSKRIPVKLVCPIIQDGDEGIQNWLEKTTLGSKLCIIWRLKRWYRQSMQRKNAMDPTSPKTQIGRRTVMENLVFAHQRGTGNPPPECRMEEEIWRYQTRDLYLNPMWIPKDTTFAKSLLLDAHRRSFHRGLEMSMALLSSDIRIQNGNRMMRKVISGCVKCRKLRGSGIQQPLGPLHHNQVEPSKAFEDVTMDGFGPMKLANGRKYWGLVSVCRTSQAVRLNLLEDLTKETMLAVLMFQWGQSGFPQRVHSDHGSNFTGVKNWLQTHPSVETINIHWTLSTPNAPWMNGKSEKMVHVAKTCLCDFQQPPKSHLEALRRMGAVEKVINSRPVLSLEGRAVSAFEIAHHRRLVLDPNKETQDDPALLLRTMKKQEREIGLIWKSQYLKKLARYCPRKSTPIKIDDVFLIPDLMKRRLAWATARVTRIILGSDGVCRSVVLAFPGGEELKRPVQGLIPLTPARAGA